MYRQKLSLRFLASRFSAPVIGVMALSMMDLAALAFSAPRASAWGVYYLNASNPNCTTCHPGFRGGFGASLHDNHLDNLVSGPCTTCHTGEPGSTPVPTGTDDPDEFTGCVGCHGRDEDAGNDSVSPGRAAGLRQHHPDFAKCADCHSDANPANYTPVGEDTLPRFYVAGLAVTDDPCSDNLDNDGNDLYDGDDDACAARRNRRLPRSTTSSATRREGAGRGAIRKARGGAVQSVPGEESGDLQARAVLQPGRGHRGH